MNLFQRGFKNLLTNYASLIVGALVAFGVAVFVLRTFSVATYGLYSLLFSLLTFVAMVSSLGIGSVLKRFLPECHEKAAYGSLRSLVSTGLVMRGAAALVVVGGMAFFIHTLSRLLNAPDLHRYFPVFAAAMVVVIVAQTLESVLESLLEHGIKNVARVIFLLTQLALYVAAVRAGWGLYGILQAFLAANLVFLALLLGAVYRKVYTLPPGPRDKALLPRVLRFGGYSFLTDASYMIFEFSTDLLIIGYFLNMEAVGLYAFAGGMVSRLFGLLPIAVGASVVFPIFIRLHTAKGTSENLTYLFQFYTRLIAFFVFPMLVITVVLGEPIVRYLFDPKYLVALHLFLFFSVFETLNRLINAAGYFNHILERVEYVLYSRIFVIYNIVMDIVLIKPFGLMGVAFATGSAVFMKGCLIWYLTRRHMALPFPYRAFGIFSLNALGMGTFLWLARGWVTGLPILGGVLVAGGLMYFGLTYLNNGFEDRDLTIFKTAIGQTASLESVPLLSTRVEPR